MTQRKFENLRLKHVLSRNTGKTNWMNKPRSCALRKSRNSTTSSAQRWSHWLQQHFAQSFVKSTQSFFAKSKQSVHALSYINLWTLIKSKINSSTVYALFELSGILYRTSVRIWYEAKDFKPSAPPLPTTMLTYFHFLRRGNRWWSRRERNITSAVN